MATGRWVLVVEDDRDLRSAVAETLEDEGYAVVAAADGREGLEALRSGTDFCLVMLDMRMPVMDGVEFRREQLRDPRISKVPVVAFSAAPEERAEAERLGIRIAIPKPVDLLQLFETVADHCGHADPLPAGRRRVASGGS